MTQSFPTLLTAAARRAPGRPLVTYYETDDVRVELSVATYANWVAKLAHLLVDEADVADGDGLALELEPHWLAAALLGAAWSVGAEVHSQRTDERVLVRSYARHAAHGGAVPEGVEWYAVTALLPLGLRVAEPLPPDVVDLGVEVWGQPDVFVPIVDPDPEVPALEGLSVAALLTRAQEERSPLITTQHPVSAEGAVQLLTALTTDRPLVLMREVTPERAAQIRAMETSD